MVCPVCWLLLQSRGLKAVEKPSRSMKKALLVGVNYSHQDPDAQRWELGNVNHNTPGQHAVWQCSLVLTCLICFDMNPNEALML